MSNVLGNAGPVGRGGRRDLNDILGFAHHPGVMLQRVGAADQKCGKCRPRQKFPQDGPVIDQPVLVRVRAAVRDSQG